MFLGFTAVWIHFISQATNAVWGLGFVSSSSPSSFCLPLSHFSLMPTLCASPSEKRSGEQSQISWAYYWKVVRTNEIVGSLIITPHFPYNNNINLFISIRVLVNECIYSSLFHYEHVSRVCLLDNHHDWVVGYKPKAKFLPNWSIDRLMVRLTDCLLKWFLN